MALGEFDLIQKYLSKTINRKDVRKGIGDDCAILNLPQGCQLALSMDTLVAGVHFPVETHPSDVGYKSLAVSLSDLAAMGAKPAWATLALTLPAMDEAWIKSFCEGLFALAEQYQVQLVGGDVSKGPLCITSQLHGFVATGKGLYRDGARPGDKIYVSGTIGEAALGLKLLQDQLKLPEPDLEQRCLQRLNRPQPRVELGQALNGIATAAIDISDGLAADLQHILSASGVGAEIHVDQIPIPQGIGQIMEPEQQWQTVLSGGDDYELCFTVGVGDEYKIEGLSDLPCKISCIGEISAQTGLRVFHNQRPVDLTHTGYQHF